MIIDAYDFMLKEAKLKHINKARIDMEEVERLMIAFAKMHVESALLSAADIAYKLSDSSEIGESQVNDEIIECYPLNTIE